MLLCLRMKRCFAPFLCLCIAQVAAGYSVLTHEAIVDTAWKDNITPLLLKRFPDSTPEDLLKAHGYAYGGAIIQDMGLLPVGKQILQRSDASCSQRGLRSESSGRPRI